MKVKILPGVDKVNDGVSRYTASLVSALADLGVEIVEGNSHDVLHLVAAHRYDSEWRAAKARGARRLCVVGTGRYLPVCGESKEKIVVFVSLSSQF